MSKSNIVTRVRYVKSNNVQQMVGGWTKYVSRENGADGTSLNDLETVNKYYEKEFGIFDDTQENYSSYIWNKNGDIPKKEILETLSKDKSGRMWTLVVSFPKDFTEEVNLKTKNDYYLLTKNIMPKLLLDNDFDLTNVEWYSSLHTDKESHPHLHICFFEKEQRRNKDTLSKESMKYLKSNIASYLVDNTSTYKEQDYIFLGLNNKVRKNNYTKVEKELLFSDKFRKSLNKDLLSLYNKLPKRGRLQYNSKHLNFCRKDIDKIIEKILYHDTIKYEFEKYYHQLEIIQREQKKLYGNSNNHYIDNKMRKLYSKIGNDILYNFKVYNSKEFLDYHKEFLKVNIMNMDFKTINCKKNSTILKRATELYKLGRLAELSDSDIKKLLSKWLKKSKLKNNVDLIFDSVSNSREDINATDFYKSLSHLGYTKDRYDNYKNKSFYKNVRFKQFIKKANYYLMEQNKIEEDYLLELLEKELKEKEV